MGRMSSPNLKPRPEKLLQFCSGKVWENSIGVSKYLRRFNSVTLGKQSPSLGFHLYDSGTEYNLLPAPPGRD